jgi:hypothetical protein
MSPISLRRLLDAFTGCFTTPTFEVFQAMVLGLVAQTGHRTVCGIGSARARGRRRRVSRQKPA